MPDWAREWFAEGSPEARPQTREEMDRDEFRVMSQPIPRAPGLSSLPPPAVDPEQATRIMEMLERNRALTEKIAGDSSIDATLNDSRQDNRQFPMNNSVVVNQTVTQASESPRRAADATGTAVAGALPAQRTQAEMEPSF